MWVCARVQSDGEIREKKRKERKKRGNSCVAGINLCLSLLAFSEHELDIKPQAAQGGNPPPQKKKPKKEY